MKQANSNSTWSEWLSAVWAIIWALSALWGGFLLLMQILGWLRFGKWNSLSFGQIVDLDAKGISWRGVSTITQFFLDLPATFVLIVGPFFVGFLAISIFDFIKSSPDK